MKHLRRVALLFVLAASVPFVVGYSFNLSGLAYDYTVYKLFYNAR